MKTITTYKAAMMVIILLTSYNTYNVYADDHNDEKSHCILNDEDLVFLKNPLQQGEDIYLQDPYNNAEEVSFWIYDHYGRLAYSYTRDEAEANKIAIATDNIPPGVYFLRVRKNNIYKTGQIYISDFADVEILSAVPVLDFQNIKSHSGAQKVSKNIIINAPPDEVWEKIRDLGGVHNCLLDVNISSNGQEVNEGSLKGCIGQDGLISEQRIEMICDATRSLSYSVLSSPFQVEGMVVTIIVQDYENDQSQVMLTSNYKITNANKTEVFRSIEEHFATTLTSVRDLFGNQKVEFKEIKE